MEGAAVDSIARLAREGEAVQLEAVPGDPTGLVVALAGGQILERFQPPPPADSAKLTTLTSLADWVAAKPDEDPVVYVSVYAVTAIRRKCPRRSRADWILGTSGVYKTLLGLRDRPQTHDQKAAIRLLRIELAGTNTDGIVPAFRNLKFTEAGQATGVIEQKAVNIGRTLQAQLTGEVPETIRFEVPVLADPFSGCDRQGVMVAVEVDFPTKQFQFVPFPMELERAVAATVAQLAELTVDSLGLAVGDGSVFPVLQGAPA